MLNSVGFLISSLVVALGLILYLVNLLKPLMLHYQYRKMMQRLYDEDF